MEHEIGKEELISQGIRDGHWLFIHYKNAKDKNTKFWISIDKIDIENKFFETTVFNIKNESKTYYKINFDKIQEVVLYDSDKKPIIELNGFEHYSNEITTNRDK